MNKKPFSAHGQLHVSIDGQLLLIEGTGPANLEMVQEYQRQVVGFREKIMHSPWASLVLLKGTPIVSPEAKAVFIETIKQAKVMHLCATAVVFIDVEFAALAEQFWREIYIEVGVPHGFFTTQHEARLWLQDCLNNENQVVS